jgi:hypothetical protein
MKRLAVSFAALALFATGAMAAEKTVLHCFAFTPVESATADDWKAWQQATDGMVGKVPGLKRVWYGKLARPLAQNNLRFADPEAGKKMRAEKKGTTDFTIVERKNGACMEFENMAAFQAYGAHEAHKGWVTAYEKVRVPGTTTYQIVPE